MFCYKHGKEFVSNELVCRRCIVQFSEKYHGISMTLRTLKRRLREGGLRRRNEVHLEHEVREIIKREIKVPSSLISLKTEQQYHNEILFQSIIQCQISHLTNCATHFFSFRVSLKFHIDGRIAHCKFFTTFVVEHLNILGTV